MAGPSPLSASQTRVLQAVLALVRTQRERAEAEGAPLRPMQAWATPFGLGYLLGAVDGTCQAHGVPFGETMLAAFALVLDDVFARPMSDPIRAQAVRWMEAGHPDFERGRQWGGNEAMGSARALAEPAGLVHPARGDEHRMGGPVGRLGPTGGLA